MDHASAGFCDAHDDNNRHGSVLDEVQIHDIQATNESHENQAQTDHSYVN